MAWYPLRLSSPIASSWYGSVCGWLRARLSDALLLRWKARYSKHYRITKDELEWLGVQVEELGRVVHAVCSERIEALAKDVGTTG